MDVKEKIINLASELFFSTGFSGTTVDDISAEFGMSKKTFYKIFPDKKTLLRTVVFSMMNLTASKIEKVLADKKRPLIEKFKILSETLISSTSRISPVFIRDVKKNAPELWDEMNKKRNGLITKFFTQVIKEGVKEGIIRKDLDKKLMIVIYLAAIENVVNPKVLSEMEYSAGEVLDVILTVLFQGVLTEKGRRNLNVLKAGGNV